MRSLTEQVANLKIEYVIATCIVLLIARIVLGRYKSAAAKSATEIVESALIAIALVFLVIRPFVVQAFFIPSESMLPGLQIGDHILVNKFVYRFRQPQHGDVIVFKSPPAAREALMPYTGLDDGPGLPPEQARVDWNVVVGHVASIDGSTGEASISPTGSYGPYFNTFKKLCLIGSNTGGRVLDVDSVHSSGRSIVVKFLGISDASAAGMLKGAEVRIGETDYIKRVIGLPGDLIEIKRVGTDGMGNPYGAVFRNGKRLNEAYVNEPPDYPSYGEPEIRVKVPAGKLWVMGDHRADSNDSHKWGFLDEDRVVGKAAFRFWPWRRIGMVR